MNRGSIGALSTSVAIALLAGCGGSHPPMTVSASGLARRTTSSWSYTVLHRFRKGHDRNKSKGSSVPSRGLLDVNGKLYGTTLFGGGNECAIVGGRFGCGTVYRISTRGSYSVLYKFPGGSGYGAQPDAGLTNANGTLYGTTHFGGNYLCFFQGVVGCGTVYSISATGEEGLLYSFDGGFSDGAYPTSDLTYVNGTLYGTTSGGGAGCTGYRSGCGTVYSLTTSGKEKVLFSFGYGGPTGPSSGLTEVDGTLYGAAGEGGNSNCYNGCGVVYSVTARGRMKVLHSFTGGSDGEYPSGDLINVDGVLYGTTVYGGAGGCSCGTVYRVTTKGQETVLYAFKGGSDGAEPVGLIDVKGTLYGTTTGGGASRSCCGTVYSISPSGSKTVLYSFQGAPDGADPGALVDVNGTLYGTTSSGGDDESGIVFALSP